jgi:hypothetical protein
MVPVMSALYRTGTITRTRRTRAQTEQLDAQILAALRESNPQSVRHAFYLMTNPRLPEPVEKSDRGYRHVQHRVTELRREGRLPYGWITDHSRRGYFVDTFTSRAEFIRRVAGLYRHDLWAESDRHVEVWAESRSIAAVVEDLCGELAVSLYPCGGFASISVAHGAADYMNAVALEQGRRPLVLYIGDYDPAGVLIDRSLDQELRRHLKVDLEFRRIAITQQQIDELDLPTKPRKVGERRAVHIAETVEAEAMPVHILRDLLRREIERHLPERALEIAKVVEEEERSGLLRMALLAEASHPPTGGHP